MLNKLAVIFLFLLPYGIYGQYYKEGEGIVTKARIIDGDTVPIFWISEVRIMAPKTFKNRREAMAWTRLVRNVKKVYPYAKLASAKMKDYDDMLSPIQKNKDKKRQIDLLQDELFAEFEVELKNLTISQGKILVKLIDRETSHTTYNIIKDYRGGFMAGFWQLTGKVFGYNLKEPYDSKGEDRDIETIVIMIENGAI